MAVKKLRTEDHVKELVTEWYDSIPGAWHYAPIQNGLGEHGIPDRVGCVPITVTQAMVGKQIGLFVAVEAKRPGRRGEKRRGMTAHQERNVNEINAAVGAAVCCDGHEDLVELNLKIMALRGEVHGSR